VTFAESVFSPHQRPPVYLAAYTAEGLARIARRADGWIPAGVPIAAVAEMRQAISGMATDAGRDPAQIGCIIRANVHLADGVPDGDERPSFYGSRNQVRADIERCADLGVDEVFIDTQFSPGGDRPDHYLEQLEDFATLIRPTATA
jgi:alkanesulfonate monooxygenase SsuD/methylene tetrahydromethanopterin reductase-like flavin-dependent oxidoreductase (luciferase family)